jgi:hypothetical protein
MTDTAAIKAQIDALRANLGDVASVAFDSRNVSYKPNDEILRTIAQLEAELQRAEGTAPPRNVVVRSNKGWV